MLTGRGRTFLQVPRSCLAAPACLAAASTSTLTHREPLGNRDVAGVRPLCTLSLACREYPNGLWDHPVAAGLLSPYNAALCEELADALVRHPEFTRRLFRRNQCHVGKHNRRTAATYLALPLGFCYRLAHDKGEAITMSKNIAAYFWFTAGALTGIELLLIFFLFVDACARPFEWLQLR